MDKKEIIEKYKARLESEFYGKSPAKKDESFSANYLDFKKELLPKHLSAYEKLCNFSARILKISPDKKASEQVSEYIQLCHLDTTPSGTFSFAILAFLGVVVSLSLIGYVVFQSLFFIIYSLIVGAVVMLGLMSLPEYFANSWRLKASNQMVQAIFYIATYMRHTSNLELSLVFASDHLAPPLSLDLKKVLWDVETEKYGSIRESLDNYLETWKKWNTEFIESFHLLEGSLMEPSDDRRLSMVDKALNVMLEETYDKMLRYAHELKGPITMLYMLGIILPILGLVILPLVASFLTQGSDPYTVALYIALFYNITIPLMIYYLGKSTLSRRPTGYGESDISDENPELKKYRNVILRLGKHELAVNPLFISVIIGVVLLAIGLMPLLMKLVLPNELLLTERVYMEDTLRLKLLDYRAPFGASSQALIGPYGFGAAILSLFIPLGIGLSVGIYFSLKSSKVIRIREQTKKLEDEFASALFQLGNRLGDGLPAEIAFGKVAAVTKDSVTGEFFQIVSVNISKGGMGLKQAIFDPLKGAIVSFPSALIESTMKVLIEASRKGPLIASEALINVSEYIKQIHRVNERLKDLMADIISDMKQQTHVLAPAIAGVVVGITSMIVNILGRLGENIAQISSSAEAGDVPLGGIGDIFGQGIPTYYFQIIVGIYVIQIVYILTILTNGIENGADRLGEESSLGKNMIRSSIIYTVISFLVMVTLNSIASVIMNAIPIS